MLHQLLLHLIKAKVELFALAKIPAIAALIVLGTTGFVLTGTIQVKGGEDEGERTIELTIEPLESKTCIGALIAETETLLELDALAADGMVQIRHLRDRANEQAEDQHKALDPRGLRDQTAASTARVREALKAAREKVMGVVNLDVCQDGKSETGISLHVGTLRDSYLGILRDFDTTLGQILDEAQQKFDALLAAAPAKPETTKKHHEKDGVDDEDDDDD